MVLVLEVFTGLRGAGDCPVGVAEFRGGTIEPEKVRFSITKNKSVVVRYWFVA